MSLLEVTTQVVSDASLGMTVLLVFTIFGILPRTFLRTFATAKVGVSLVLMMLYAFQNNVLEVFFCGFIALLWTFFIMKVVPSYEST